MAAVAELLAPYRRVIVVDLPGHGESDDFEQPGGERNRDDARRAERVRPGGRGRAADRRTSRGTRSAGTSRCVSPRAVRFATATAFVAGRVLAQPRRTVRAIGRFKALRAAASVMGDRAPSLFRSRVVRYPSLAPFFAPPSRVSYENAIVDVNSLRSNTALDDGIDAQFVFPPVTDPTVPSPSPGDRGISSCPRGNDIGCATTSRRPASSRSRVSVTSHDRQPGTDHLDPAGGQHPSHIGTYFGSVRSYSVTDPTVREV